MVPRCPQGLLLRLPAQIVAASYACTLYLSTTVAILHTEPEALHRTLAC